MSWIRNNKQLFQNAALSASSLLFAFLILEVFFRFLPVNDGFNFEPVSERNAVFHAQPNQTVTASMGWDFHNARDLRINNFGFRNDQDYAKEAALPLIAVIGDSYVEAVQVDYDDTFYGLLAERLKGKARVYSFGYSGAPLSQYLIWAQYAVKEFKAANLTFVIVSNDFDESLGHWRRGDGFHQYESCGEGQYCLERVDLEPAPYKLAIKPSSLARYLIYNLQVLDLIRKVKARNSQQQYVANAPAEVDARRSADSMLAIDLFLKDLPFYTGLPAKHISFVVDGRSYGDAQFDGSYFGAMRRYFIETAQTMGYHAIDMKPAFASDFAAHAKKFETARDGHWNEAGHRVVADRLYDFYRVIGN
jgi:hypothetical protein